MYNFRERLLAFLLCLMMLTGCIPAVSEEIAEPDLIEEIISEEAPEASEPAPEQSESDIPDTYEPESEDMNTEGSDTATPEPTDAPDETPSVVFATESDLLDLMKSEAGSSDIDKAEWLYTAVISILSPGSAASYEEALASGKADRVGYAETYAALLNKAGISAKVVHALEDPSVAWNIVKLNGSWTHVDVYTDDASSALGCSFGLTDAVMSCRYTWNASDLPGCTASDANYFVRRGYTPVTDPSAFRALVENADETVYIYNAGAIDLDAALEGIDVILDENDCYASVRKVESKESIAAVHANEPTIVVAEEKLTLGVGDTHTIAYTSVPSSAAVTFYTSNSSICKVSSKGVISALKAGNAIITISNGGHPATVQVQVVAGPTAITGVSDRYNATAKTIYVGKDETIVIDYKTTPASVKDAARVVYSSDNTSIATISSTGEIRGIKTGETSVTLKCYNGIRVKTKVTVVSAPSGISVNEETMTLGVGETGTCSAVILGDAYDIFEPIFSSADNNYATVDPKTGKVTALKEGTVDIIASTYNGKTSVCKLTIVPEPTSLSISGAYTTLAVGEKMQLDYALLPENSSGAVKWSSSSTAYATVSAAGVVTAKKVGSVTITAKAYNGTSNTYKITVKKAATKVSLTAPTHTIGVGEELQTTYKLTNFTNSFLYTSSKEDIASISETGMVTGLAIGKTTLKLKAGSVVSPGLVIEVKAAPEYVTADSASLTIAAGDSNKLTYTLPDDTAGAVFFTSNDKSIATVAADGTVTGVSKGSTFITLTTYNGKSDTCAVTVTDPISEVSLTAPRTVLGIGEKLQLTPTFLPEGVNGTVTYSSSASKIVSVSKTGVIKAKKKGSAVITVKTYNGLTADLKITVKKAPTSVSFSVPRKTIGIGETIGSSYAFPSGTAGSIDHYETYPADDPAAVIDDDGKITAKHAGSVQIRCVSYNGKTSKAVKIEVVPAPTSIKAEQPTFTIAAESTVALGYILNSGSAGSVTFTSSDPSVCIANGTDCTVTGVTSGKAMITMTTYNGRSCTCMVNVMPAPSEVSLTSERIEIGVGETLQLQTAYAPADAMTTLTYASSKTSVAKVNANGVVTAKAVGATNITVTTHNNKTATLKITVKKAPTSVKLSMARDTIGLGEHVPTKVKFSSDSAGSIDLYESSDESIITIDENGVVYGKKIGSAYIRATSYNGKVSNVLKVTVAKAPTAIACTDPTLKLGVGETYDLGYRLTGIDECTVTFASGNESIAAVDRDTGLITAVGEGTCLITLTTYNDKVATCRLTVTPAPTEISMSADRSLIGVKEQVQLYCAIEPSDASSAITYTVSPSDRASVDPNTGILTAKKAGNVTVTAATYNNVSASLTFTIKAAPSEISLSRSTFNIGVGEQIPLASYVSVTENTVCTISYESYNEEFVSVDPVTGMLSGVAVGEASVCVSTHNGKTAICTVSVGKAPTSVALIAPDTMGVGQTAKLSSILGPDAAGCGSFVRDYSIVSGDKIVSLSEDGTLTALLAGTAVIRVDTYLPNVYATKTVTIKKAPTFVEFPSDSYTIRTDEMCTITPIIDDNAATSFTWSIAKAGYFTIDDNGTVTPISRGTTKLKVTTHNGLSAEVTVTIIDPYFPESIEWAEVDDNPPKYLSTVSGTDFPTRWVPQIVALPETSRPAMEWSSSDESILRFDATIGAFIPVSYGVATVTGISARNPSLTLSAKITVISNDQRCLITPWEYKSISGMSTSQVSSEIAKNRVTVNSVMDSAFAELASLESDGTISSSESSKRQSIIKRAFAMLDFPWTTSEKVPYWTSSYDASPYNHSKDYKTNTLYFGLPYTQTNREFNQSNIVSKGYYTGPSNNVYRLNTNAFTGRKYAGNDCSSFVSQAEQGSGHYGNTTAIADSSFYTTLSKTTYATKMRPGDILVRSGHHVVMFLYYTNAAKTEFMIIEQGGSDDYHTNVVACRIKAFSKYSSNYIIRRPKL